MGRDYLLSGLDTRIICGAFVVRVFRFHLLSNQRTLKRDLNTEIFSSGISFDKVREGAIRILDVLVGSPERTFTDVKLDAYWWITFLLPVLLHMSHRQAFALTHSTIILLLPRAYCYSLGCFSS